MKTSLKVKLKKYIPSFIISGYRSQLQNATTIGAKVKRQFIRPSFPKLESGETYLHLGCGSVIYSKFINIDALAARHIHYVRSIDNLSIFKDSSVDLIYACHCLEHFSYNKVPKVLTEWFRVLNKDGILRLSVPDFDLLLEIYKNSDNNIDTIIGALMGGQDYEYNFHMAVFNRRKLIKLLYDTGFKKVEEWQPGSCDLTTCNDYSTFKIQIDSKLYPVSLNLQAVK